jgi:Flp pilus assembly pilin Flp
LVAVGEAHSISSKLNVPEANSKGAAMHTSIFKPVRNGLDAAAIDYALITLCIADAIAAVIQWSMSI